MATRSVVAVDIGAESGRVMLVHYDGRQLQCEEIRRFPNRPAKIAGHLFWDVLALWNEICLGLGAARQAAGHLDSIGIDTWGVDYALVDAAGLLVGQPYQYRDHRTDSMMDASLPRYPADSFISERASSFCLSIRCTSWRHSRHSSQRCWQLRTGCYSFRICSIAGSVERW